MKKIVSFLLLVFLSMTLMFTITACDDKPKFTKLSDNETLRVYNNHLYRNSTTTDTTEEYLTYTSEAVYTLKRTSSDTFLFVDYTYYNGYYYFWETETTTKTMLLGTKTITRSVNYSYLLFGENNIAVKEIVKSTATYDYEEKTLTKPRTVTIKLSGYFSSKSVLQSRAPEILDLIDLSESKEYHCYARPSNTVNESIETYRDTYWYFE